MQLPAQLIAAAITSQWQSVMHSTTCGLLGAAAVITALVVFARKRDTSGWKTIVVLAFGSLLVAVPVLHNFSLSWTADGKPVVNFSLNAVIAAIDAAKEEAKVAAAETRKLATKVDTVEQSLRNSSEQLLAANGSLKTMTERTAKLDGSLTTLIDIKAFTEQYKKSMVITPDWGPIMARQDGGDADNPYARLLQGQSAADYFKQLDKNADGKIDVGEFKPAVPLPEAQRPIPPPPAQATPK